VSLLTKREIYFMLSTKLLSSLSSFEMKIISLGIFRSHHLLINLNIIISRYRKLAWMDYRNAAATVDELLWSNLHTTIVWNEYQDRM